MRAQGLTVQVGNTDAEGRLALADGSLPCALLALTPAAALSYAQAKYKPQTVIDFATLTGSRNAAAAQHHAAQAPVLWRSASTWPACSVWHAHADSSTGFRAANNDALADKLTSIGASGRAH